MVNRSILAICGGVLLLGVSAFAQSSPIAPQLLLDNDVVRVSRITLPAKGEISLGGDRDVVLVKLHDELARFIPKGNRVQERNASDHDSSGLLIELKKHWDVDVHACSYPMKCTRETTVGQETVAWTTTLFTNGFVTGSVHKLARHGTLASSYYTARGTDAIVVAPFTDLDINFGGTEESLRPGQPYFSPGTEVEANAKDAESRWFVLRMNMPAK
jgi:hypothetical protein